MLHIVFYHIALTQTNLKKTLAEILSEGKYPLASSLADRAAFFIWFLVLARRTTPELYGEFVSAFVFSNILAAAFDFGFPAYVQRAVTRPSRESTADLSSILLCKIAQSAPFFFIVYFYLAHSAVSILFVLAIAASLFLFSIATLLSGVLWGTGKYRASANAALLSRAVLLAFAALSWVLAFELPFLIAGIFVASVIHLLLLSKQITVEPNPLPSALRQLKTILRSSLPIGIGLFFGAAYDRIDVLLIKHLLTPASVAYYAVAYALYRVPAMAAGVILTPSYTDLSHEFSSTKHIQFSTWRLRAGYLLMLALFGAMGLIAARELLLKTLYGEPYAQSSSYLAMLSAGLPALLLNNYTGITLNAVHLERQAMMAAVLAVASNVALNIFLLPIAGITGAVAATVATEYFILAYESIILVRAKVFQ